MLARAGQKDRRPPSAPRVNRTTLSLCVCRPYFTSGAMLKSLVSGAKRLAAGGGPQQPADVLFPRVAPEVDGEDCLRDCESCSVAYPRGFKIDEGDELYGHVKGWATHVLVATGKSDWVRDVADEKGSVMQAIEAAERPSNGASFATHVFARICCNC